MTEKNYNPEQRNVKSMKKQTKTSKKVEAPIAEAKHVHKEEPKKEEKTIEHKKEDRKHEKMKKKGYSIVRSHALPISTKQSMAVCKFIKNKGIEVAIEDLKKVISKRMPVPMKGEIPHRKGKIMSGRFPKNTSEHFIKMLKSLSANSNMNGMNNPVVTEAVANMGQRPFGSGGRFRRKRTHIMLVAREGKNG